MRGKKGDNTWLIFGGLLAVLYLTSQDEASNQNENLTSTPAPTPQPQRQKPNRVNATMPQTTPTTNTDKFFFIAKVQRFLRANGYVAVSSTGTWNAITQSAQLDYMKKRGIKTSADFRKIVENWKENTKRTARTPKRQVRR